MLDISASQIIKVEYSFNESNLLEMLLFFFDDLEPISKSTSFDESIKSFKFFFFKKFIYF